MARIELVVENIADRMTLRAVLERGGHTVVTRQAEVVVADSVDEAIKHSRETPTLMLASASQIPGATRAMAEGVFGYVFVPLQPGEVNLMVQHALGASVSADKPELESLETVEFRHILVVLRECNYNQAEAARVLGIGRNTLWRKLKKIRHPLASEPPVDG